jgi:ribosomal protein S18 acetylase RimI-like enzyme
MQLELIAARGWPALETERLDGWLMRHSKGVSWRANSVLPCFDLYSTDLQEAITKVFDFYEQRQGTPAFKMTETSQPPGLDKALEDRGYQKEMVTYVQTAEIEDTLAGASNDVIVTDDITPEWLSVYAKAGGFTKDVLDVRLEIMDNITHQKGFALGLSEGQPAGVAMAVVEDQWMGLFSVGVLEKFRRRGVGQDINKGLAQWGSSAGAKSAYLQVEAANAPAIALYANLGFRTLYTYWYRILRRTS